MPVSFNQDSVFNLKPIRLESIRKDVEKMLVDGEEAVMAFRTVRDQLVFTNKRIIAVDVQGLTGTRRTFSSMPYKKVQYFSIQTPGFGELMPDTELFLVFSNSFTAKFEFRVSSGGTCSTEPARGGEFSPGSCIDRQNMVSSVRRGFLSHRIFIHNVQS